MPQLLLCVWQVTILLEDEELAWSDVWRQKLLWKHRLMTTGLTNLDFVIEKYEICLLSSSTTRQLMASVTERWSCVQSFCRDTFVDAGANSRSYSAVFIGAATVNISSANKMLLMSLDGYFSAVVSDGWVCTAVCCTQFWSCTNISQRNVATRFRCGGMFSYCFVRNLLWVKEFWKSVSIWQS